MRDLLPAHGGEGLLKYLDPADRTQLFALTDVIEVEAGTVLIRQGSSDDRMFLIEAGEVEVYEEDLGPSVILARLGPGEVLGEMTFIDGVPRSATARAAKLSRIRVFERGRLFAHLRENPALLLRISFALNEILTDRLRDTLEELPPLAERIVELSRPPASVFDVAVTGGRVAAGVPVITGAFKEEMFRISRHLHRWGDREERYAVRVFAAIDQLLGQLPGLVEELRPSDRRATARFLFKETFPYFMSSRTLERAYFKPRGYPGDYLTVDLLYQGRPEGDGAMGRLVDQWALQSPFARAVRGRRELLASRLLQHAREAQHRRAAVAEAGAGPGARAGARQRAAATATAVPSPVRILSLSCGPAREVFDFLASWEGGPLEIDLVDIDREALAYGAAAGGDVPENVHLRWIQDNVIKMASGRGSKLYGEYDLIYSASLADYLDDQLFVALVNACFRWLNPGGVAILGNLAPHPPTRVFLEYFLDWALTYRSEADLRRLIGESVFSHGPAEVVAEPTGLGLFAVLRLPRA